MSAPRPRVLAVTGGIASGKSAVTARMQALGLPIVDADVISRELVEPGQPALGEIVDRFGNEVIGADGRLDRAELRRQVFADADARRVLEAILHPRVRSKIRERVDACTDPWVVLAIPLLVESAGYDWVDRVLVVDAPVALQVARVMLRDGVARDAAERIVAAQADRATRLARATDVIVNDGDREALVAAVDRTCHMIGATGASALHARGRENPSR